MIVRASRLTFQDDPHQDDHIRQIIIWQGKFERSDWVLSRSAYGNGPSRVFFCFVFKTRQIYLQLKLLKENISITTKKHLILYRQLVRERNREDIPDLHTRKDRRGD